jgi:N-acetylglucosamine kinase-like BadF-type ATPase
MILIADSGSTKTNWRLVDETGAGASFSTEGYNPYFVNTDYISQSLLANLPAAVNRDAVTEVHFYGAGCASGKDDIIETALQTVFPGAQMYIAMDLLAAARALLGAQAGFAAILGTGTNTCLYDGQRITQNIDSLGFTMGDEGSGAAIGKKLLADYMRGYMPEPVRQEFWKTYRLSANDLMHNIYALPLANRYCAGFCRFISDHMQAPYLRDLVMNCFREFFQNLVSRYPAYQHYSFNSVGSVGFYFSGMLEEVSREFGMPPGTIILSPMDGLVKYHVC